MAVRQLSRKRYRARGKLGRHALPAFVFAATFGLAAYALEPDAPGKEHIRDFYQSRTTDQHFANCSEARRAGRQNIPAWDPSYRERMDRDGDGLACEPYGFR